MDGVVDQARGWKCIVLLSLGLHYFQFRDSSARRLRPISPLAHTPRRRRHSTTGPVSISAPTAATAGEASAPTRSHARARPTLPLHVALPAARPVANGTPVPRAM